MADSYSGELPLKGNMKIPPVGGKDNAREDEGLAERICYNPPEPPLLKVDVKPPCVPMSLEKKPNSWHDQRGDFEKISKKLEEVLNQTPGMASLTACARLLGINAFLRSISDKECLNMTEVLVQAIVDGVKEIAAEKDREIPDITIKLKVGFTPSG